MSTVVRRNRIVRRCALATTVVASIAILGWVLDLPSLRSLLRNLPEMRVNTALAFLIVSAGLFVISNYDARKTRSKLPILCSVLVSLIGLAAIGEYLAGSDIGIDSFLVSAPARADGIQFPGRMSPYSAFNFVVLGISLGMLGRGRRFQQISEFLAILVSVTTFASVMGYVYGVEQLYGDAQVTAMALNSAVLFFACSFSLLSANFDSETGKLVTSDSLGGMIARRLIPAVVLVPLAIDFLRVEGQALGLYEQEMGSALMQFTRVLIMVGIILYLSRDVHKSDTARRILEKALAEKEQQFRDLFDYSQGMICIHDLDGVLLTVNPATLISLGYKKEEIVGKNLCEFLLPEHALEFKYYLRQVENEGLSNGLLSLVTKDGRTVVWRYHNILVSEPNKAPYILGHAQDVTELLKAQKELENLSLTDELTGLYNRRGFLTMAEHQLKLEKHARTARGLTMMFADIDGLKSINDRFGHEEGSDAISQIGMILSSAVRDADIVARWGGDEFVMLTIGSHDEDAEAIRGRIAQKISEYNASSGKPYQLACSIGVAPLPLESDLSFEGMVARADEAMYAEKRRRKELAAAGIPPTVDAQYLKTPVRPTERHITH